MRLGHATVFAAVGLACLAVPAQSMPEPAALWSQATLYRDEWGVPHVYAENPQALGFAYGYAQADDRIETLLLAYRMANGRLAAVLGPAYAESDAFSIKMNHARLAQTALEQADPVTRDLCEGFALGINSWIVDHPGAAPAWADGAQAKDVLALWHAFLMSFAPFDAPGIYHRPPAMETGNAWAMAPSRTADGRAVLVINPHEHFDGAFQWCEAHLILGDIDVSGAALCGVPVIVMGHNATLGWALTPNFPDFADVYNERFAATPQGEDTKSPKKDGLPPVTPDMVALLEYMAQAQPYYVRTDAGMEERSVPSYIGPRGPLFENSTAGLFSWRIGGYYDFGGLRQLMEMGRAANLGAFQDALRMQQLPCFHITYADRDGNIFYLYNSKAGARPELPPAAAASKEEAQEVLRWDRPLPVGVDLIGWAEGIAVDSLPAVTNPASGYVQACGSPPWTVTENAGLTAGNWPGWLSGDAESYRARRARELLRAGTRSFRDNQSMLFDTVVPAAMDTVPALLSMAEQRADLVKTAHPDLANGLALLKDWNFTADVNSAGMTFYHVWWAMLRNQAGPAMTERDLYALLASNTPPAQEAALRAAEDASRMLRNEFQTLSVPWGERHRLRRGAREEAAPGSATGEPILLISDQIWDDGKWIASYGTGFAMAVQFGDIPEAVSLSPFGASDNPRSSHYSDQMDLLTQRRFKRALYTPEAVMRHADHALGTVITLLPQGVTGAVTFHGDGPMQARLVTQTKPPSELPEGYAAFTLYVAPQRSPQGRAVRMDVSMHVPAAVCADDKLAGLALFTYEDGLGWYQPQPQEFDAATRTFHARHDTMGRSYAVLGPVSALQPVPPESARPDGAVRPGAESIADAGPVGIDVLLQQHALPRPITGTPRFKLERLDAKKKAEGDASKEKAPEPEAVSEPGKMFKFERHDAPAAKKEKNVPVMPEIPGFRYGPGISDEFGPSPTPGGEGPGKKFKIDRLDRPQLPQGIGGAPASEAPAPETAVLPAAQHAGEQFKAEAVPADAEKQPDVPPAEPPQKKGESAKEAGTRPELPAVIPQDPSFNFGPTFKPDKPGGDGAAAGKHGTFHIERVKP
jgi:acyl-homoserine lactone acylase PvdQ